MRPMAYIWLRKLYVYDTYIKWWNFLLRKYLKIQVTTQYTMYIESEKAIFQDSCFFYIPFFY